MGSFAGGRSPGAPGLPPNRAFKFLVDRVFLFISGTRGQKFLEVFAGFFPRRGCIIPFCQAPVSNLLWV